MEKTFHWPKHEQLSFSHDKYILTDCDHEPIPSIPIHCTPLHRTDANANGSDDAKGHISSYLSPGSSSANPTP